MNQTPGEVRAVLIPLHHGRLLLPNASVAEVVGYQEPETLPGTPDWLAGMISWRQQQVPLVCFDRLAGMLPGDMAVRARIAVCNALGGNPQRPYIALLAQSVPRLVRVSEEVIRPDPEPADLGAAVLRQVLIGGEGAWIPDLDVVERLVEEALA